MGKLTGPDPVGATPIDDYSDLKLDYLKTKGELYQAEFANIVAGTAPFFLRPPSISTLVSRTFFFRLHKAMLSSVWGWAGKRHQQVFSFLSPVI